MDLARIGVGLAVATATGVESDFRRFEQSPELKSMLEAQRNRRNRSVNRGRDRSDRSDSSDSSDSTVSNGTLNRPKRRRNNPASDFSFHDHERRQFNDGVEGIAAIISGGVAE
jgi:hypothetical protein